MNEVVAAEALVRSLEKMCHRGKVDTGALAELSGQHELEDIDIEHTSVKSVAYDPALSTLTISFDAIVYSPFWKSPEFLVGMIVMMILASIALIIVHIRAVLVRVKSVSQDAERTYASIRRASQSRQSFMSLTRCYGARGEQHNLESFMPKPPPPMAPDMEQLRTAEMSHESEVTIVEVQGSSDKGVDAPKTTINSAGPSRPTNPSGAVVAEAVSSIFSM